MELWSYGVMENKLFMSIEMKSVFRGYYFQLSVLASPYSPEQYLKRIFLNSTESQTLNYPISRTNTLPLSIQHNLSSNLQINK